MAAFDLEEQEQISQIKGWGAIRNHRYGDCPCCRPGFGWLARLELVSGKQGPKRPRCMRSSNRLPPSATPEGPRGCRSHHRKYSGTSYADLAALLSAKVQSDAGDLKNARVPLAWAAEKANDPALRSLARLRLASVLLDEKAYDEALAQVQAPVRPGPRSAICRL